MEIVDKKNPYARQEMSLSFLTLRRALLWGGWQVLALRISGKIWHPTICPSTMNTKGSELKIFSLIVSTAVHLSTKSILVMKRKFYATNTAKNELRWSPITPCGGQEWPAWIGLPLGSSRGIWFLEAAFQFSISLVGLLLWHRPDSIHGSVLKG